MSKFPFYHQPEAISVPAIRDCFHFASTYFGKLNTSHVAMTKLTFGTALLFLSLIYFNVSNNVFSQNNENANKKDIPFVRQKFTRIPNADAKNAIEIKDSIAGPFNVSYEYGMRKEYQLKYADAIINEMNSVWFKFTIHYDTMLTFDIVPFDSLDDYDFVLFKCSDTNCIDEKGNGIFKKIRSCWSQCFSKSGLTGLSKYTIGTDISVGPGPAYVSSIQVKAGETYYLVIDFGQEYLSERAPAGFKIYFYNYYPKRKPIVLNNIFFETGKSVLQKESFPELDKLVLMLSKNQMVIEIRGHTDNEGDEKKNLLLSEERAKSVVDYLISKKINKNRLFYKGFGSSKPITSNATQESRQKNRRVEFIKVMY
ncbi:MAG: OmpA family protein [Bacteroidota bacterium]